MPHSAHNVFLFWVVIAIYSRLVVVKERKVEFVARTAVVAAVAPVAVILFSFGGLNEGLREDQYTAAAPLCERTCGG